MRQRGRGHRHRLGPDHPEEPGAVRAGHQVGRAVIDHQQRGNRVTQHDPGDGGHQQQGQCRTHLMVAGQPRRHHTRGAGEGQIGEAGGGIHRIGDDAIAVVADAQYGRDHQHGIGDQSDDQQCRTPPRPSGRADRPRDDTRRHDRREQPGPRFATKRTRRPNDSPAARVFHAWTEVPRIHTGRGVPEQCQDRISRGCRRPGLDGEFGLHKAMKPTSSSSSKRNWRCGWPAACGIRRLTAVGSGDHRDETVWAPFEQQQFHGRQNRGRHYLRRHHDRQDTAFDRHDLVDRRAHVFLGTILSFGQFAIGGVVVIASAIGTLSLATLAPTFPRSRYRPCCRCPGA